MSAPTVHRIRQFILAQLREHESLRYSDMRPSSMEASQFMYHLRALVTENLVHKLVDGQYALTAAGKLYVDRAGDDLALRHQPRIGALYICHHPEKGLLYVRRTTHPAHGMIGFPIIDIPLGFPLPLTDFASAVFAEMCGLTVKLVHRADGYINVAHNNSLEGSLLAHVFTGTCTDVIPLSKHFEFLWESDLPPNEPHQFLESTHYVLEQLHKHPEDFFFFENTVSV